MVPDMLIATVDDYIHKRHHLKHFDFIRVLVLVTAERVAKLL